MRASLSRRAGRKLLRVARQLRGGLLVGARVEQARGRGSFMPSPWIRIDPDNTVTVIIDRSEMGQGAITGLSMLVAEELEVDLGTLKTEFAPADPVYNNRMFDEQTTGGSTSVRAAWMPLRQAGAAARELLIHAAALTWGAERTECHAEHGAVVHAASGRRLAYGTLADRAATLPVPEEVALKPRGAFRIIGRSTSRLDIPGMVAGRTVYGADVDLPGMLVAAVQRSPTIGARVTHWDGAEARRVEGVRHVVAIESGIAVVADDFWTALRGREALKIKWEGGGVHLNTESIRRQLHEALQRKGHVAQQQGNARLLLDHAAEIIETEYETPYLAHATLEPMNCTAHVHSDGCKVWVPTQTQEGAQKAAARVTGLPLETIRIHTTFLGGGFGRRLETDMVEEAVEISHILGAPVQVLWTREDDMRHDRYRPANCTRMRAVLDERKRPAAWMQRIAGPKLSLEGVDVPYAIPNLREEHVEEDPGVPTGAWRSVGASQNAFAVECFIDELACAADADPLGYRLALLEEAPRHRGVLELAADRAGWGSPPPGHHQGLAVYRSFGSWVAEVAEVSVTPENLLRVHRVVCAIDCGQTVNPDCVIAQVEGAVAFGLSAALKEAVSVRDGRIEQATFEDYPILTLSEMPQIEVHIVDSDAAPGGVGEPGVPPVAPALANAAFAATDQRLRSLPLRLSPS